MSNDSNFQMTPFQFDANTVEPAMGFEPWPDGWYMVVIRKSNQKPTADGKGRYLELQLEAGPGPKQGQTNFIRLNLWNDSPQAVEIAHKTLSAICRVTGVYTVNAMPQPDNYLPMLHNIPFQVRYVIQKNKETNRESNNAVAFKDQAGNDPSKTLSGPMQSAPSNQPQQPQQPSAGWGGQPQPQQMQPQQQQPQSNWGAPQQQPTQQQPTQQQPTQQQPTQNWGAPQQQQPQPQPQPQPQGNPNQNWTQQPNQAGGPWNRQ